MQFCVCVQREKRENYDLGTLVETSALPVSKKKKKKNYTETCKINKVSKVLTSLGLVLLTAPVKEEQIF